MTYHDQATQLNQIYIYQPNLDRSPQNFQHRPTVGKQIWSEPNPDPTSPTLICHDLSWPSHNYDKDINTKHSRYVTVSPTRLSMTSRMTLSTKSLVRNLQCPQSTPILDLPFLTHFYERYQHETFKISYFQSNKIIYDIKDDPVHQVSGQEPSMSSESPSSWPHILDTLLLHVLSQNFQGIFHRVKQDPLWHQGLPCPPSL